MSEHRVYDYSTKPPTMTRQWGPLDTVKSQVPATSCRIRIVSQIRSGGWRVMFDTKLGHRL